MNPFRWDVIAVTLVFMVPVVMTSDSFTVGELAMRLGACLVAATVGLGVLRALSTPAETPPVERDGEDRPS